MACLSRDGVFANLLPLLPGQQRCKLRKRSHVAMKQLRASAIFAFSCFQYVSGLAAQLAMNAHFPEISFG